MIPDTMKGLVFTGDRRVEVREFPVPSPGPGQVLIQMKAAAICGSDLHTYRRERAYFSEHALHIPGHEPAGIVAEVGPECHRVTPGDRVCIYHYVGCGHCAYCRSGYMQFCPERRGLGQPSAPGPDADYMVIDERNCLPLPEELSFEDGALIACIAGTCYSAMLKLRPNGETDLAVFGQGPVGLMGTIMARALGARVVGVEPSEVRRALALEMGAEQVLDPSSVSVPSALRRIFGEGGASAALETSGNPDAHRMVLESLRTNGVGVFVGFGSNEPSVNLTSIIGKQLTLMGSFVMPIHLYDDLVRFILRHDLQAKFRRLVTHRFRLAEAEEAFRVADSASAGKVMFVWD